ncbi:hypothetical protein HG531_006152 [Fusarium graminearum]|nr:hypothetical protein HG531_006152 [Fusarium graminearum]
MILPSGVTSTPVSAPSSATTKQTFAIPQARLRVQDDLLQLYHILAAVFQLCFQHPPPVSLGVLGLQRAHFGAHDE